MAIHHMITSALIAMMCVAVDAVVRVNKTNRCIDKGITNNGLASVRGSQPTLVQRDSAIAGADPGMGGGGVGAEAPCLSKWRPWESCRPQKVDSALQV